MLSIIEYAVLKAIADGEDVKEVADVAVIERLINRGFVSYKYEATDRGKDELNEAEETRARG